MSIVESCEARRVDFGVLREQVLALHARVKFELFFAVLTDYLGWDRTHDLVSRVYLQNRPNPNHVALGRLSSQHHVFTTNFDENIEAAGGLAIEHLHGRASDPSSLAITLRALSTTNRPELEKFETELRKLRKLVCVGYSGWGDVDIFPIIDRVQKELDLEILWFDRRPFKRPLKAAVFYHNLFSAQNALLLWSDTDSSGFSQAPPQSRTSFKRESRELVDTCSVPTLLRSLASEAHEARFGNLGLELYKLTARVAGEAAVSNYEWGVAYERANNRAKAARHLELAALESSGQEASSHLLGAAFCYRQIGRFEDARRIYDESRDGLQLTARTQYAYLDNLLRGRLGLYIKLLARTPSMSHRRHVVDSQGLRDDIALLRTGPDPQTQRPGRLELLLDIAELQIDILTSSDRTSGIARRCELIWQRARGFQDLEIEAQIARTTVAVRRDRGRTLLFRTALRIIETGASKRDLLKVVVALLLSLIPFVPNRWFLLNFTEIAAALRDSISD